MDDFDALLRARPLQVDRLELRRLVSSVRARVLGAPSQTRLGRYVLEDKLGEGGFGIVYGAFDPSTQRRVALKVLRSDPSCSAPRELREEARALAAVRSEHVVRVLDFGREGDQAFFVMGVVEGRPLRTWTPRTRAQTLSVLDALFRGVEAIHAQRLAHCDLKPDNVFVDPGGRPVIVDFGLALSFHALEHRTHPVGGSPPYSAPEQFTSAPIDARVDQFALGRIGLELLRQTPGPGDTRRLSSILRRASAPDAADRFESVAELRRALRSGTPVLGSVAASLASLAAVVWLVSWATPTPTTTAQANAASQQQPPDPLRARIEPIHVLLLAERFDDAQTALDAVTTQTWLEGDPSSQADERAMRAELARSHNDLEEARQLLESAVWLAVDGERYETVAVHSTTLAIRISQEVGDAEAANRMMNLAWSAVRREGEPPHLAARYWNALAHVERFSGRPALELRAAKMAVQVLESTPKGPSAKELITLGSAYLPNEQLELARETLERARVLGGSDPEVEVLVAPLLATIEWQLGEPEKSIDLARSAVEASTKARGRTHPLTVEARAQLGLLLIEFEPTEAVIELRAVLETYGARTGLMASITRANLAVALAAAGLPDEAEALLLAALADLDAGGTVPLNDLAYVWGMLGDVRAHAGQSSLAKDAYRQALDRLPSGPDSDSLRTDLESRLHDLDGTPP